ncbi:YdcH family protein [Abyssibius alkaniclasticus]|uniref:YdcH family protein n=1 Tax=Abyssibius alkaniclasticus TaxID=2881234 RepID=UPI004057D706
MSHRPNSLADQFPDQSERIHALKLNDAHFARLADDYEALNNQIHRAETNLDPVDDFTAETWRKQRLALLDQIAPYLR